MLAEPVLLALVVLMAILIILLAKALQIELENFKNNDYANSVNYLKNNAQNKKDSKNLKDNAD
ncbi:MAG: hypothetical protein AB7V32_09005 [Candidatus Berkiella sp.]